MGKNGKIYGKIRDLCGEEKEKRLFSFKNMI